MAGPLSQKAWVTICAAAGRKPVAEAEARAELSRILFEEPALPYARARWAEKQDRAERMLKHLTAFAKDYRRQWLPDLKDDELRAVLDSHAGVVTDDSDTVDHFWCLAKLHRRVETLWDGAVAIREANARRRNSQRALLYYRLCRVWLEHFQGALTSSVPPRGGPPSGPLIKFMLAALRQVVPKDALPSAETLRDVIEYERRSHDLTEQRKSRLRQRAMGF
jgi:hypothetical protein